MNGQPAIANKTSPLIHRDQIRALLFYGFSLIGLLALVAISYALIAATQKNKLVAEGLYRTDTEMVNGGKRFLDYYYSLNSATVKFDQFRALSMITEPQLKDSRMRHLIETDYVRRVEQANLRTEIEWSRTQSTLERDGDQASVVYKGYLRFGAEKLYPFHIVLKLTAVKKDDVNVDGVGVVGIVDIAKSPFEVTK